MEADKYDKSCQFAQSVGCSNESSRFSDLMAGRFCM